MEGGLKSVLATLDLLDCFMAADELGVSDIARRLGVAKSSAHRMLTTLAARGLVEKNAETGRYRLGLHVYELGALTATRNRLRNIALPVMEDLRRRTGHTIHLTVADGADVIHLERLQSMHGIQVLGEMKRRFPAHSTSGGKAIAAFDPAVAQARREADFPVLTRNTAKSVKEFDAMLADVRRLGYAMNRDEALLGFTSIAAPILDPTNRARAAISMAGPTEDFAASVAQDARLVISAARCIAKALPWVP
ncbi:MAG: IclR family transcriptional regulator [Jatrophihabitans sp.]|uniref:IclR family transcriptional regulator n=1 Tax=Jatrophihabitans sp. TaxID=1932789 RepID=UPI003F80A73F